jgi:uncharacterized protein YjiS (DUF1127 family)
MHLVMADSLVQDRAASQRSHGRLRALLRQPAVWFLRSSRRRELRALEPEQMKDCGIDPVEAHREAIKPFWCE